MSLQILKHYYFIHLSVSQFGRAVSTSGFNSEDPGFDLRSSEPSLSNLYWLGVSERLVPKWWSSVPAQTSLGTSKDLPLHYYRRAAAEWRCMSRVAYSSSPSLSRSNIPRKPNGILFRQMSSLRNSQSPESSLVRDREFVEPIRICVHVINVDFVIRWSNTLAALFTLSRFHSSTTPDIQGFANVTHYLVRINRYISPLRARWDSLALKSNHQHAETDRDCCPVFDASRRGRNLFAQSS